MFEYEIYEETKEIIVKEDGEELAKLNYSIEDSVAVIDSIKLSKNFERNMGENPMDYYFNFFKNVTRFLKQPLEVTSVVIKDFAKAQELDDYITSEIYNKKTVKAGMR